MRELTVKLKGDAGYIPHNIRLANPLDEFAKKLKAVSSKRKKVEGDFEKMAKLEWYGSHYLNADGEPVLPADNLTAMLAEGAKKIKMKKVFASSVWVEKSSPIKYPGPKNIEELWDDVKYRLCVSVRVGNARVMRTRPIFHEWESTVNIKYHEDQVGEEVVLDVLKTAGVLVGIGDWRPRYGRFTVQS